jgi:glutathione S-transferase
MKVYGFPLSPFVRKVAVAAREKGIEFDWVPSNPSQPTEEFLKASPFSKIPAIADGDFTLADSTAIVTYFDIKYPSPRLIPADAEAAGRAIWFEEVADTVMIPAGAPIVVNRFLRPVIFGTEGDEAAALAAEEAIKRPLEYLESQAGHGWLDGEFSIGDIAVACTLKTLTYARYQLDAAAYPKLAAWYARVEARPAWQKVAEEEAAMFAALRA